MRIENVTTKQFFMKNNVVFHNLSEVAVVRSNIKKKGVLSCGNLVLNLSYCLKRSLFQIAYPCWVKVVPHEYGS